MTEQEKNGDESRVIPCRENPRLRYGGTWVENVRNMETCAKISFAEAVRIIDRMLYGPIEEVNNDG